MVCKVNPVLPDSSSTTLRLFLKSNITNRMRACCWVLVITCCWGCSSSSTSDHVDEEIQRLKSWFASVRQDAAKELGWTKDRRAVEPLIAALKDRDCRVRYEAMKALGEIKDPRAVGPLIAAMKEVAGARMQEGAAK